ncbi:MAG TPA: response regulator [Polyangiaceae bacterium]
MDPQKTILIIDDDTVILDTARRLLERDGLRVLVYSEGFNATNFAAQHRPDLVLMDVNMPFLSGDTLAGVFKRHAELGAVPLLLFSSNEEGELRRMARDLGVLGYISKSDMGDGFSRRILSFLSSAVAR